MPVCDSCGSQVEAGDAFCQACGSSVSQQAEVVMTPPVGRSQEPPPTMTPPPAELPPASAPAPMPRGSARHDDSTGFAIDDLLGESEPNQMYLGNRLLYGGGESFDPLGPEFEREMAREAAVAFFLSFVFGFIPLWLMLSSTISGKEGLGQVSTLLFLVAVSVPWGYFWLHSIPAQKSEWKLLVDDQGQVAGKVFQHIVWAFERRGTPVDQVRLRRLSGVGDGTRDYLEVRMGIFAGYVSTFAYGSDLYIGWSMWWRLSPLRWLMLYLKRIVLVLKGQGSQLHLMYRYEDAKAMREALHAASREGVDAAAGLVAHQASGTIGSNVQVESVAVDVPTVPSGAS